MDRKTYGIGILFITATVLFVAQFLPLPVASAEEAIRDRDYSVVTAPVPSGNDALYIADSRTGMVAVFTWDNGRRMVAVRDVKRIADAFQ
jgi:hypothetical protein